MKNYLCTIPQQPPMSLKKIKYANPCDNAVLECPEEVSFPIIALIRNTAQKDEKIRITAIKQEHENCELNYVTFTAELDAMKKEIGFDYTLDIVSTPFSETIDDHQNLFGNLIDHVYDGDTLYTDITYGTKPIPMILLMTLTYAYRFKKDSSIESIIYGQMNHDTRIASLYDVSALFYMNSTINTISDAKDPKEFIKGILSL